MSTDDVRDRGLRALADRVTAGLWGPPGVGPRLVVCGDTKLAHELIRELQRGDARVTAVVPRQKGPRSADVRGIRGIRVVAVDRLDAAALRLAGVAEAEALALTDSDDVANLHAAFCAREVNPRVRLAIRMFHSQLAAGTRKLLADCVVLSDASMAAPAFVAAALGAVVPEHFRLSGRTLTVARRVDVRPEDVVCGLAGPGPDGRTALLPADESRADLVLAEAGGGRPGGAEREVRRLARIGRWRRPFADAWWTARGVLRRGTTVALLTCVLAVAVASWVLARAQPGPHDFLPSLYLALLTTAGNAEIDPAATGATKAAQVVLALAGLAFVPLLTAAIVDTLVTVRLARESRRLRHPWQDHVVVVGLGHVGIRVIRQLHDLGVELVAVEKDPTAHGVEVARQLGIPVIIGDASQEEVQRSGRVAESRALVVLSTDDVANLETALVARAARADLRVVLRLYDGDFATRVQRTFQIGISRSVSMVSAPMFAAKLLEREVFATIPVERHVLQVASVTVEPGAALAGAGVAAAARPGAVRVLAVARGTERWWNPDPGLRLQVGDRVVAVCRRAGLAELAGRAQAPPPLPELHVERRGGA
ncbi:potassium transporter TrkA [Pilimelia terevasa]|uniref:Potassium transporter TrkA n=1 Tax=Pilimelia terevasa TaxID=53372 RepID=A0A8J3BRY5_9ACTN|nr:NAD-binding protein [Pilimelia terevasa]GGK29323.1 potassium transporter TrkA [Pilimelia terevasa]